MQGTIRLFKFAGIQVYLHFTWFIAAAYMLSERRAYYRSPIWAVYEYVALFGIVLLHEFGHSLACRQVGGRADQIVLWPLGGVAFVDPPRRPGAVLWSIAAGPLVNVVLVPILSIALFLMRSSGVDAPDFLRFLGYMWWTNFALLIFNMLPVYPLDGGQILRALLWFPFGEIRSLQVASVVGLIGGGCLAVYALMAMNFWFGLIAFFLLSRAIAGWQYANAMVAEKKAGEVPPAVP